VHQQLASILDAIRDPVLVTDDHGHVQRLNHAARTLFAVGYELVGCSVSEIFPKSREDLDSFYELSREGRAPRSILINGSGHAPAGRRFPVRGYVTPIDLDPPGFVVVVRDAEAEKAGVLAGLSEIRISEALAGQQRAMEELHDSALQTFIALGLKLAVAERLACGDPVAAQGMIADAARIARDEQRSLRLHMDTLWTPEACEEMATQKVRDRLYNLMERASLTWEMGTSLHVDEGLPELSPNHQHALLGIVREGVVNAARHGRAASVDVRVTGDHRKIALRIHDDGTGFPFLGSYTHDQLMTDRRGPMTLKRRVNAWGGRLDLETQVGRTVLSITLPFPECRKAP